MRSHHLRSWLLAVALGGLGGLWACGEDEGPVPRGMGAPTAAAMPGAVVPGGPSAPGLAAADTGSNLIVHKLTEESFIESPTRRDPFRSFLIPLTAQQSYSATPQIVSLLDQYQIDELKLVAIVSGSGAQAGSPMAMVQDPAGVGHILRRGNYVGKGETVRRVSSGEEIQIFWKVARIRDDAIVFEREDPFAATEATVTKILPLLSE